MYAVVKCQGMQYKVEPGMQIKVPLIDEEIGKTVELEEVMLIKGDDVKIGAPFVEGAKVKAEIVQHGRYPKVIVFKKRRRKDSKVKNGHRQHFTELKIQEILG